MKLNSLIIATTSLMLSACVNSPGYLFSNNNSAEMSELNADMVEEPITEQMQALTQSCRNNEALELTSEQASSAMLDAYSQPIRNALIDLACQLTDQQIGHMVIYITPVNSHPSEKMLAQNIHQSLVSQAKLLGIEVMNLAVSAKPSAKLNTDLRKMTNGHETASVLSLNLNSFDTQHILASKQVVLNLQPAVHKLKKTITLNQAKKSASDNKTDSKSQSTETNQREKSIFLKR